MLRPRLRPFAEVVFTLALVTRFSPCQTSAATLPAGTPLTVTVSDHLPMRAGQPIHGSLVYPIYADGKLILPEKTVINGTEVELRPNRSQRNNARLNGDFTPFHTPVVQFTSLTLRDGRSLPLSTNTATDGAPIYRLTAPPPRKGGFIRGQYDTGMEILHQQIQQITAPHKGDRLLQLFYHQLPYHPERIESGTSWTLETTAPLSIPVQTPSPSNTAPAPAVSEQGTSPKQSDWMIQAYLDEDLSSANAKVGQPVKATVAEPIYNPDHTIAVPQGAMLVGAVTKAKSARSFARAGQLGFDFKQLILPGGSTQNVQTALSGADSASTANLQMDSEGKVKPKPQDKLVVPLILTFLATRPLDEDNDFQGGKNFVGANGFGIAGNIIGWAGGSRNIAAGIGAYGAALSVYRRWIASGQQVHFPHDTRIVVQTMARNATVLKPESH